MFVISISSVSEVQMDFTSDFYFRQFWRDPRLAFPKTNGISQIFVGAEVSERIWVSASALSVRITEFACFHRIISVDRLI